MVHDREYRWLWKLTGNETLEEGLASEVSVVLLEVLLARGAQLQGNELEAAVLEARDDGANETTLEGALAIDIQLDVTIYEKCVSIAISVPGHHRA